MRLAVQKSDAVPDVSSPELGSNQKPLRVLYLVYWGAVEPIGTAGTVPTVEALVRHHDEEITLLTFDKEADRANRDRYGAMKSRLRANGVRWVDLRYTKRPPALSTIFDIAKAVLAVSALVKTKDIQVLHARTYVGAVVGALVSKALGTSLIVHPDGFWPEERVDDGVWLPNSRWVRGARAMHEFSYAQADAIVVLTHKARARVEEQLLRDGCEMPPIAVIPTSVDVSRFESAYRLRRTKRWTESDGIRFVYLGSLGGRYASEEVFRFVKIARQRFPQSTLRVVTRVPAAQIFSWANEVGLEADAVTVQSASSDEVPALLATQDVGIFFLREGLSSFATSATKVGEYLACGIPVVVSPAAGDYPAWTQENKIGVCVHDLSPNFYGPAIDSLASLLRDDATSDRCREASTSMSVDTCARAQATLHRMVHAQKARLNKTRD